MLDIGEARDRRGEIGQVGPGMADIAFARIGQRSDRLPGPHHRGAEPGPRRIAEKISRPDHERASALRGGPGQHAFHLDPHRAFAGSRVLRRAFVDQRPGVRTEIIDVPGKYQARAARLGGGDGILQHRNGELAPAAIARRIGAVKDQARVLRGGDDIRRLHGVAFNPFERRAGHAGPRLLRPAVQRLDPPAAARQSAGDCRTGAARGADHQRCPLRGRSIVGHGSVLQSTPRGSSSQRCATRSSGFTIRLKDDEVKAVESAREKRASLPGGPSRGKLQAQERARSSRPTGGADMNARFPWRAAVAALIAFGLARAACAETITVTHWGAAFYGAPYAVAMDKGFFKQRGVDITGVLTSTGGGTSVRNTLAGDLPYGDVAL